MSLYMGSAKGGYTGPTAATPDEAAAAFFTSHPKVKACTVSQVEAGPIPGLVTFRGGHSTHYDRPPAVQVLA